MRSISEFDANRLPDHRTRTELHPPNAAEIIYVNVREPLGPLAGALLYYAVLAYPNCNERRKRRAFVEAMAAMRYREFGVQGAKRSDIPAYYRRYKREKMLCRIRLGWNRIHRRVHAATMGWCIYLNERHHRFDTPTADGKIGIHLRGPNTVNGVIRALIQSRENSANSAHLESQSEAANVAHRIWAESFPVLHLAMENPIAIKIIEEQVRGTPPTAKQVTKDLFDSVREPSWLRRTLEDAESLKLVLADRLGANPNDPRGLGYKPERAISLLPTEDPALAYRL